MSENEVKIMPTGDSITAGYYTNDGGYRSRLQRRMREAGYAFTFVGRSTDQSGAMSNPEHEGYSGYQIRGIAAKATEAIQLFHPDIILLFAGTNDVRDRSPGEEDNSLPESPDYWGAAPDRLEALITQLTSHQPGVIILVGTLLPFRERWAPGQPRATAFNQRLPEITERQVRQGRKVFIADLGKTVSVEGLADGIHPNIAGYERIAETWFHALDAVLRDHKPRPNYKSKTSCL